MNLTRLSDEAIEIRLADIAQMIGPPSPAGERVRQQLLAIRLERDLETWLAKMPPEKAAQRRAAVDRALAHPEHTQWFKPDLSAKFDNPAAREGRCSASTKQVRQDTRQPRPCMRAAVVDGLCFQHARKKHAAQAVSDEQKAPE